ncbi:MAG: complex I subunit 1 family protein [Dehalococcoidia bacterium]|nr:complex I subunit 1 family protein [Dehalococcoidia bacterium]
MGAFLATDNWWDLRDLSNISREILEAVDAIAGNEAAYIISPIIGFIASFLIFVLPSQLFVGVYGERKLIGRMQSRYGPNRVGPYGLLQPVADAIKLIQKQSLTPRRADIMVMYAAPILFVMPAVMVFAVIPFGENMVLADIPEGLTYFVAITSIPVVASFMAGWSSDNKYSLFGAMRMVAMTISYEVPLVLTLLGIVLLTGTLNLNEMVVWQSEANIWVSMVTPLSVLIVFICSSAELEPHTDRHRRSRIRDRRRPPHGVLRHEVGPVLRHGHRLRPGRCRLWRNHLPWRLVALRARRVDPGLDPLRAQGLPRLLPVYLDPRYAAAPAHRPAHVLRLEVHVAAGRREPPAAQR